MIFPFKITKREDIDLSSIFRSISHLSLPLFAVCSLSFSSLFSFFS